MQPISSCFCDDTEELVFPTSLMPAGQGPHPQSRAGGGLLPSKPGSWLTASGPYSLVGIPGVALPPMAPGNHSPVRRHLATSYNPR